MDASPPPFDARLALRDTLDTILRRITGQTWSTPRQTQLDAGNAITLLYEVEVLNGAYLASQLGHLVRALGARRPDTAQFVGTLENFIAVLDEMDPGPAGGAG
jgi:hypothetical protein